MTIKLKSRVYALFIMVLFFSGNCRAQETVSASGADLNLLNEIVKITGQDSIFVSNAGPYADSGKDTDKAYHFYSRRTKSRLFPDGYEAACPFVGRTALVKLNNNWGLIDRSGKFVHHHPVPDAVRLSSYEKYVMFGDDYTSRIIYRMSDGNRQESSIACAMPATPDYFISKTGSGKYHLTHRNREPVFHTEFDSIIANNPLLYEEEPDNLLLAKKKGRYHLLDTKGKAITRTTYTKARFTGAYVLLFKNQQWDYYTYQNRQLHLVLSSPFECITPAYQKEAIGVFRTAAGYNILKVNGKVLPDYFDSISSSATYGVKANRIFIFGADTGYYPYTEK